MRPVWKGIYSKFTASTSAAFYADMRGQMFLQQARQNTTFPYCVFSIVGHDRDWMFNRDVEDMLIQFNIFDDRHSSDIGKAFDDLNTLYDGCQMTTTGYNFIHMNLDWSQMVKYEDEITQHTRPIWQYTVQYHMLIETT